MIRTITALFDSASDALVAKNRLGQLGLAEDQITVIDQQSTSTTQAQTEAESGGMWAKIKDFFLPDEDRYAYEEAVRRGGYLLTARVDDRQTEEAIRILEHCNAVDLDQRQTEWRSQGWAGAPSASSTTVEPTATAGATTSGMSAAAAGAAGRGTGTGMGAEAEQRIALVEERLRVGKREVGRGGVRVRSYLVEEPVHEEVRLRDEHVEVERRPVNETLSRAGLAPDADLLREQEIEMTESHEEAVVDKQAVVTEEVVVRKRADERVERIDDTVRHTEVDVENLSEPTRPEKGSTRTRTPGSGPARRS
jgi:uncharacterized protein (TIGR02271 family)